MLFLTSSIPAQKKETEKLPGDKEIVFTKIEIEASTNAIAWRKHLEKMSKLPDSVMVHITPGVYNVRVQFIVDVHGNIGQVKALNDPGFDLGKKAEIIVAGYTGEWRPAVQCGRNVKAYRTETIVFAIPVNTSPNL